jgi:DNA processing protein
MSNELFYSIALSQIKGVGNTNAKILISYTGSAEQVFKEPESRLQRINGVGPKLAAAFKEKKEAFERAEQEMLFIEKQQIQALLYYDKQYPKRLLNCSDAPLILFCKGNFDFNKEKFISIIGTRHATERGREITEKLIAELAKYEINLVSGLAFGIDICAHQAASKHQVQNIAALAHGLDRIYPSLHKNIAEELQWNGALISDYMSGTVPDKQNFPSRNRIVAGMTDATIVVESAITGGALITAEIANNYNKDVFAFPGRITDKYAQGCLKLIKQHKAQLITSAQDIIESMNWDMDTKETKKPKIQQELFLELTEQEKKVFDILQQQEKISIDFLMQHTEMTLSSLSSNLLQLEMKGIVMALPGKQYKLSV